MNPICCLPQNRTYGLSFTLLACAFAACREKHYLLVAVIEGYSEEFEAAFLEHLRRAHPSARVSAKVVYNEFINDKHHVHMNSTKWLTLTDFVKYLGKTGKCKVDQTEKGWHLVYVKKDIEEELNEERKAKRHKAEKVREIHHTDPDAALSSPGNKAWCNREQADTVQASLPKARVCSSRLSFHEGGVMEWISRHPEATQLECSLLGTH